MGFTVVNHCESWGKRGTPDAAKLSERFCTSVLCASYPQLLSGLPDVSPFWPLLCPAEPFSKVQAEVAALLKDRILVGHALHNDLKVTPLCALSVPMCMIHSVSAAHAHCRFEF